MHAQMEHILWKIYSLIWLISIIIAAKVVIKFCCRMCFICACMDVTSSPAGIAFAILHEQIQMAANAACRVGS